MFTDRFDPELLYVECAKCGRPVIWSPGDTTKILEWAGIDASTLDDKCMIVSEGCPSCQPGKKSFSTQVIRLKKSSTDRPKKQEAPAN